MTVVNSVVRTTPRPTTAAAASGSTRATRSPSRTAPSRATRARRWRRRRDRLRLRRRQVLNSTISGNVAADGSGGGMYLWSEHGTVLIANSTISGNRRQRQRRRNRLHAGQVEIVQSTISGNTADRSATVSTSDTRTTGAQPVRGGQTTTRTSRADHRGQGLCRSTGTIVSGNADGTDDIAATRSRQHARLTASVIGTVNGLIADTDGGGNQMGVTDPGLDAVGRERRRDADRWR